MRPHTIYVDPLVCFENLINKAVLFIRLLTNKTAICQSKGLCAIKTIHVNASWLA